MAQSKSDFNQLQEDMLEVGLEFDEATGYPILDDDQESQYIRVFAEVCGQLNWFYHCRQCCTFGKGGGSGRRQGSEVTVISRGGVCLYWFHQSWGVEVW